MTGKKGPQSYPLVIVVRVSMLSFFIGKFTDAN